MPEPATHPHSNKGLRLHLASFFYFFSRFAVVAFVFAVPALYFLRGHVEVPLVMGGVGGVTIVLLGYYLAAAPLRCPACSSPVLMDNGNRKHPYSKRFPGLSHRARVAWDILFKPGYHCMYCHTLCRCKGNGQPGFAGQPGGAPPFQQTARIPTAEPLPESVFGGIFGGEGPVDESFCAPGDLQGGNKPPVMEHVVTPSFSPPTVFPASRTKPVSVPSGRTSLTPPFSFPPTTSPEAATQAPPPALHTVPTPPSPMPWAKPATEPIPANVPTMNRSSHDHPAAPGSNPFLAAAAAMPPPPSPALPYIPPSASRIHAEPTAPVPASEGLPPWTLPSPSASAETPASTVPARTPSPITAPVLLRHSAPPAPQSQNLPADLLKDLITALEEGRRSITGVFQTLIEKIESRLAIPEAPAPAIVPSLPARPPFEQMISAPPPILSAPPLESAFHGDLPREKTAWLPPPPAAAAVTPVPVPSPAGDHTASAAPRKKFVRPPGIPAQELSSTLSEVFDAPAAASLPVPVPVSDPVGNGHYHQNGNGHHPVAFPVSPQPLPPPASLPPPPLPPAPVPVFDNVSLATAPVPAWRPPSISTSETPASPFAVSAGPLTSPPAVQAAPAPFTFLKSNGDHFAPAVETPPVIDPLDDSLLPWMQPMRGRA